jgi:hypothetical protein
MANTYEAIATVTVGSGGAATIDFTSIPATYTDLCVLLSIREETTTNWTFNLRVNNDSSSIYSYRNIQGNGSTAESNNGSGGSVADFIGESSGATANTFGNLMLYIPNYAGSTNKSFMTDAVGENNATLAYARMTANLWASTAAINQLYFYISGGDFAQYSTATLYGIKNS